MNFSITKNLITLLTILISTYSFSQNRPKSMPNGGSVGGRTWTIEDYENKAKRDSLQALKHYNRDMLVIEKTKPKPEKKKRKKRSDASLKQQEIYDSNLKIVNDNLARDFKEFQTYRDEWVAFLKADKIAKVEAQIKKERSAEKRRLQLIEDEKIAQEQYRLKQIETENRLKEIPADPAYKKWKLDYESALSSSQSNVDKCEAIIKKHTFKNAFGEKMYDSSDFSQNEKDTFNKNLESISNRSTVIRELEDKSDFYNFWIDSVSNEKASWSYRIAIYFRSKSKV